MSKARELLKLCEMQDIVVKNGKKFYKPKKPYYSNMPSSKFEDITERDLNALISKVITKPDVHYSLSDLFTEDQLNALMDSEVYKLFSKSMKDDISNALMGESKTYSALEFAAKEASKDSSSKIVADGISLAFYKAKPSIFNAMSILSKDKGQELFDELVSLVKASKLKTKEDVKDYLFDKFLN